MTVVHFTYLLRIIISVIRCLYIYYVISLGYLTFHCSDSPKDCECMVFITIGGFHYPMNLNSSDHCTWLCAPRKNIGCSRIRTTQPMSYHGVKFVLVWIICCIHLAYVRLLILLQSTDHGNKLNLWIDYYFE